MTFRDFLHATATPFTPPTTPVFADVARSMTAQADVVIHDSFAEAYDALQANNVENNHRRKHGVRVIGKKFERFRSHIAYAVAPKERRISVPCGVRKADGCKRIFALHATKGWRVLPGVAAA